MIDDTEITLEIAGLGIVFYSPSAASHIAEGEDYLTLNYTTEEQVQSHIQQGTIVGFGTGSPGTYMLKFRSGYPDEEFVQKCDYKLRLGVCCSGGLLCFRDLYDLMQWHVECPPQQRLAIEDGIYHVTLCSNRPSSGIIGDNQEVLFYLQMLEHYPALAKRGIPMLVT